MKRTLSSALLGRSIAAGVALGAAALSFACSSEKGQGVGVGGSGSGGTGTIAGTAPNGTAGSLMLPSLPPTTGPDGACGGLECQVPVCSDGGTTTISGKVFDPAGKLPLYNVLVYVPNGPVPAFNEGISCDRCATTVTNPVTSAITDETGSFKLPKAPAGQNIPLVIQVGKWRRQLTIPTVAPCVDTALTDPQQTRLPRNKTEGDIPRIAIAAGGADAMECFPRRLGIDDSEFTTSAGDGRIHLYTATDSGRDLSVKAFDASLNGGAPLPHSTELWASLDTLRKYDIVVLSCEGAALPREKPMASREALYQYLSEGGRVFASHWSHVWFSDGPDPVPTTGDWNQRRDPTEEGAPLDATVNETFPKGEALAKWLVAVGASTTQGTLTVTGPRDNIQAVEPTLARDWITIQNPMYPNAPESVEYLSFNAPLGAPEDMVCGRAVFTGLHVSTTVEDETEQPPGFPLGCAQTELSPQEKAVAFMLFDLSSCVQSDAKPPEVPR
jgi:hypothetical protein